MSEKNNYSVYRHTFPNGKVYIGITSNDPLVRWDNGMGYASNQKMFFDIVQYGWKNIEHEVLKNGLSKDEANDMEQSLISAFGDKGRELTYNTVYAGKRQERFAQIPKNSKYFDAYGSAKDYICDDWVEPYTKSGMYLALKYKRDSIKLCVAGKNGCVAVLSFFVPENLETMQSVCDWLYSVPTPDCTTDIEYPRFCDMEIKNLI